MLGWVGPLSWLQAEARFRRLLLEDKEEAVRRSSGSSTSIIETQVEAEECNVRRELPSENRVPLIGLIDVKFVARALGLRGVNDGVGIALKEFAAHQQH